MPATIAAPTSWIESIGEFRLPAVADRQLQSLMDRNTEGLLQPMEKEELAALTAAGRATIHAPALNHPRRLRVREAEALFDLFPPTS